MGLRRVMWSIYRIGIIVGHIYIYIYIYMYISIFIYIGNMAPILWFSMS